MRRKLDRKPTAAASHRTMLINSPPGDGKSMPDRSIIQTLRDFVSGRTDGPKMARPAHRRASRSRRSRRTTAIPRERNEKKAGRRRRPRSSPGWRDVTCGGPARIPPPPPGSSRMRAARATVSTRPAAILISHGRAYRSPGERRPSTSPVARDRVAETLTAARRVFAFRRVVSIGRAPFYALAGPRGRPPVA